MKLLKQAVIGSLSVSVLLLTACGGGGDGATSAADNLSLKAAAVEIGQADFTGGQPNQGTAISEKAMNSPFGSSASDGTKLYVVDTNNSRVLGYNALPAANNTGASFALGQPSLTTGAPNNGTGTSATVLAFPSSAAISGTKLVVTDTDNNRVLIWNTLPAANVAPNVVIGQADFVSSASGTSASTLSAPQSAIIANGKLVVADTGNNRVLIWNTVPTTNGVAADVVLGQADFVSNASVISPTQASLRQPQGVWTDGFNLLVSDTGTNRVLYWKQIPSANNTNALFVMGQPSFIASTGSSTSALMKSPTGVFYDGTHIYVADTGNNRVLVFTGFPLTNSQLASAVLGQEDFSHSAANDDNGSNLDPQDGVSEAKPTQRTLSRPTGVLFAGGKLYVTDTGNSRVMQFVPPFNAPGT